MTPMVTGPDCVGTLPLPLELLELPHALRSTSAAVAGIVRRPLRPEPMGNLL
jgi:hypothetical protein